MIPAWEMKDRPLARSCRSCWGSMPARIEGVRLSSASEKIHCDSVSARTCAVVLGGWVAEGKVARTFSGVVIGAVDEDGDGGQGQDESQGKS